MKKTTSLKQLLLTLMNEKWKLFWKKLMKSLWNRSKKLKRLKITVRWRIKLKRLRLIILKNERRVKGSLKCINKQCLKKRLLWIRNIKKRPRIWKWMFKKWERSLKPDAKNSKNSWWHTRITMKLLKHWRKHMPRRSLRMSKSTTESITNFYNKRWTVKMHWENKTVKNKKHWLKNGKPN